MQQWAHAFGEPLAPIGGLLVPLAWEALYAAGLLGPVQGCCPPHVAPADQGDAQRPAQHRAQPVRAACPGHDRMVPCRAARPAWQVRRGRCAMTVAGALRRAGLRAVHLQAASLGSVGLCVGEWVGATALDPGALRPGHPAPPAARGAGRPAGRACAGAGDTGRRPGPCPLRSDTAPLAAAGPRLAAPSQLKTPPADITATRYA